MTQHTILNITKELQLIAIHLDTQLTEEERETIRLDIERTLLKLQLAIHLDTQLTEEERETIRLDIERTLQTISN
jgi:hypothetical protein